MCNVKITSIVGMVEFIDNRCSNVREHDFATNKFTYILQQSLREHRVLLRFRGTLEVV
jgi:hypothetical protein